MMLGIDSATGVVYQGLSSPYYPLWPYPILALATLVDRSKDAPSIPTHLSSEKISWIFREDYFDPVTRVRRGRLYEPSPDFMTVRPVSANVYDSEDVKVVAAGGKLMKNLQTYNPCLSILERNDHGLGVTLALGFGKSVSFWRSLLVEKIVGDDILITLKATSTLGVIPEIDVPQVVSKSVHQALERVVESAYRETPTSLVDQCRNAVTVVLSRWMITQGESREIEKKDLGFIIKSLLDGAYDKRAVASIAEVVRLLHPRGKSNEQEPKNLRIPVEEDAELAVHALGFILREIGWAT